MSDDRLTRQTFEHDLNLITTTNWSGQLREILCIIGKENNLENHEKINTSIAIQKFKELANTDFQDKVNFKPKLRSYKLFKQDIETEKYVTSNLNNFERSLIAKLRSGTLPLAIETGRFRNIDVENRTCTMCDQNLIEDEKHFICICSLYHDLRLKLYSDLNLDHETNTNDLFIKVMRSEKIYCLSSFMVNAWQKRTNFLYNMIGSN